MKLMFNCLDSAKNHFWFTCCSICLSIIFASAAVAEYKKPKTTSAPDSRTTTSTATRGGCINSKEDNLDLTAIAPYSHVGQTVSTRPTFFWFVPASEYFPLEFHLEEYTANSQSTTIHKQKLDSKPGIMSLSLPQSSPDLTAGKKYRWKVVMRCTRYKAVVVMAELEVVTSTPEFQTDFSNASGISQLVDIYSSRGLWYNALETTLNAAGSHKSKLQNRLIQELVAVEAKSTSSNWVNQQGDKLNRIGDYLKSYKTIEN